MPCREPGGSELVVHAFPPQFPLDTDYLAVALAEFNAKHRLPYRAPKLAFAELEPEDRSEVLARAQKLKDGAVPGAGLGGSSPSPGAVPEQAEPVSRLARVAGWLRRVGGRE